MSYLNEAFKALDALNEDTFDVSADGIKKLAEFENTDDLIDEITVFDEEAETEEDLQDSYVGKVIVDCNVCHSKIYKDKEDIHIDEETQDANVDEECPYCFSNDGFKVIGEVVPMVTDAEKEDDETEIKDTVEETKNAMDETTESEDKPVTEENIEIEESLTEATVTDYEGSLSNVLVKHKDELSTLTSKMEIMDFLNKISSEVRDQNYLETVIRNMQKKNDFGAVQYLYGIILSGEGKGVTNEDCKKKLKEDLGQDIDEYQEWVDYDMKRYGKISDQTNKEIKEAGLQIVKDKYGHFEVVAGNSEKSDINESTWAEIERPFTPVTQDKLQLINEKGLFDEMHTEIMYNNPITSKGIASIATDMCRTVNPAYSDVTIDEIKDARNEMFKIIKKYYDKAEALSQDTELKEDIDSTPIEDIEDFIADVKDRFPGSEAHYDGDKHRVIIEMDESCGIKLTEDIDCVTVVTDNTKTDVCAEDDKITVTTEPVENKPQEPTETIAPISDETEKDIEDIDIDEFDKESFDELGESYLKEVYDNVEAYKTSKVNIKDNKFIVEGLLKFTNGNEKKLSFMFESNKCKDGKLNIIGESLNIAKGQKAFSIMGKTEGKKFISESLNYNYRVTNDAGKSTRCEGTVKKRG